jgi:polyisoprenoid-binding protein YceI
MYMKKLSVLLTLAVCFLMASTSYAKQAYWKVDTAHSTIGFTVKHLGLSKVHGSFNEYESWIKADENTGKLSWVKAKAKVSSVSTGIQKRDAHLLTPDFFDATKYPDIVIETVSIQWNGDTFSGKAKLTMKGVTREVAFSGIQSGVVTTSLGGTRSIRTGYEVSATINRKDFGLNFNAVAEGVNIVSDEVTLNFEVQTYRSLE